MKRIHLGISTCPNDTFAFHGLLSGKVASPDFEFEIELLDVQELNQRLFAGDFDVAKASFHAALRLANDVAVLASGSALGFGNGPLLLAAKPESKPGDRFVDAHDQPRAPIVLCPGEHTTATLLYKLFYPGQGELRQAVFSEIMPALQQPSADFGVCIHEGRFTWQEQGLSLVADLGEVWEQETKSPLPLGGILARRSLGEPMLREVQKLVRGSLEYGLAHRQETLESMRKHAQEFSDEVLFAHVDLYVNEWTRNLGDVGQRALAVLAEKAAEVKLVAPGVKLSIVHQT